MHGETPCQMAFSCSARAAAFVLQPRRRSVLGGLAGACQGSRGVEVNGELAGALRARRLTRKPRDGPALAPLSASPPRSRPVEGVGLLALRGAVEGDAFSSRR